MSHGLTMYSILGRSESTICPLRAWQGCDSLNFVASDPNLLQRWRPDPRGSLWIGTAWNNIRDGPTDGEAGGVFYRVGSDECHRMLKRLRESRDMIAL